MKSIFVTGTDTGVGKTVTAAALLVALREQGLDTVPMKPVQTGCEVSDDRLLVPDLDACLGAGGLVVSDEERALMCPYMYEPACSPHLAAELAGGEISLDEIVDCFTTLEKKHGSVVVEGAGGIMVPVCGDLTMLDLMVRLGLPVVLVARPGLGTINHTLLSLDVLKRAELTIAGVVLCEAERIDRGFIEEDNVRSIERFGKVPILGTIPFMDHLDPLTMAGMVEIDPA